MSSTPLNLRVFPARTVARIGGFLVFRGGQVHGRWWNSFCRNVASMALRLIRQSSMQIGPGPWPAPPRGAKRRNERHQADHDRHGPTPVVGHGPPGPGSTGGCLAVVATASLTSFRPTRSHASRAWRRGPSSQPVGTRKEEHVREQHTPRIAIFGATGSLGSHVARLAVAAGHDVSVLVRAPDRLAPDIASKATITTGDLMQQPPSQLGAFISGHDVLISCAGLVTEGQRFVDLFDRAVSSVEALPESDRPLCWLLAGAGLLDLDSRDGVTSIYPRCATCTGLIGPSESVDCACRSNACPLPCRR